MIQKTEKAELCQVLYSSPHTNEVFLYFKGYHTSSPSTLTMQCVVLDQGFGIRGDPSRDIKDHCKSIYAIDESSLLGFFIDYLDSTPWDKQK